MICVVPSEIDCEAQMSAIDAHGQHDGVLQKRKGKEPNLVEDSLFSGSGGLVPEKYFLLFECSIHENCSIRNSGYCP